MPTITDYLKYANLQMAAEALYDSDATIATSPLVPGKFYSGDIDRVVLETGNRHSSKFTATEAKKFTDQWTVVEHISNTTTGFSGTLFQAVKDDPTQGVVRGQYTLSFRSTEFLDDAARDNQATNVLEISKKGWAFGQISDMEAWYQSIQSKIDGPLSVTGYSLGGHLATAFNLLHPGAASEVITFNGAGVGKIGDGSLATTQGQLPDMIRTFQSMRQEGEASGLERLMQSSEGRAAYLALKTALAETNGVPCRPDDATKFNSTLLNLVSQVKPASPDDLGATSREADYQLLWEAVSRARQVFDYAHWAPTLGSGSDEGPPNPANVQDLYTTPGSAPKLAIAGESLDYQLAVLATATQYQTQPLGLIDGAAAALGNPTPAAGGPLPNQWDIAGTETTTDPWYMVAYSQYRYGNNVNLFIEDQPFARGNAVGETVKKLMAGEIQLLHNEYDKNDFGDTHSLVLIVDSLNAQNTLLNLLPEDKREAAATTLNTILTEASWRKAEKDSGQGKAEGDVLENTVNALADLVLGPQKKTDRLNGCPDGNTWASTADIPTNENTYTGRNAFYKRLNAIVDSDAYQTLAGTLSLVRVADELGKSAPDDLANRARTDFTAYAALYSLSPFELRSTDPALLEATAGILWNDHYTTWAADKANADSPDVSYTYGITDQWLADRAAFLTRKTWYNANNVNPDNPGLDLQRERQPNEPLNPYELEDSRYEDKASGYNIQQGLLSNATRRTLFGAEEADTLEGGGVSDHLYGGAGNDTLNGQADADHLEGHAGNDILNGGSGNDTLMGGAGHDTYLFLAGDGIDLIEDSDGQGSIQYAGQTLTGATQSLGANVWRSNDNTITYTLTEETQGNQTWPLLTITIEGNSGNDIKIKRWQNGQLGITLAGAPGQFQGQTILGDQAPQRDANGILHDQWGNILPAGEEPGRNDTLYDTPGTDRLKGLAGQDILSAERGGKDLLEGGAGADILYAGAGNDKVYGDEEITISKAIANGREKGAKGEGTGQKGDWINGGAGNDVVIGGADNDALFGGEGRDILIGGAGDDDINGDDDFTATEFTWTITDTGTVSGGAEKLRSTAIQLISNDNNWRQAA
jgi:Ca2+-binding RTX toxin-like protein